MTFSRNFLPPLLITFIILRYLLLLFSSPSIQICFKKMPPVPLSCHKWWAPCPILPATLPRSVYFFLFEIFLALFRAFIAFGYFVHGFWFFNITELHLSLGFIFFFISQVLWIVQCSTLCVRHHWQRRNSSESPFLPFP